jgi:hypothetical protein
LKKPGQLNPVIGRRREDIFQMIDGKGWSAENLGWKQVMILEVTTTQGKAMMLNYNMG